MTQRFCRLHKDSSYGARITVITKGIVYEMFFPHHRFSDTVTQSPPKGNPEAVLSKTDRSTFSKTQNSNVILLFTYLTFAKT